MIAALAFAACLAGALPLPQARAPFAAEGANGRDARSTRVCEPDFWKDDALDVPASPVRNLMVNGSFEQDFKGCERGWACNGSPHTWPMVILAE